MKLQFVYKKQSRRLVALLFSCLAVGCSKSELHGNPTSAFDHLKFDSVRAYKLGNELVIAYEKDFKPKNPLNKSKFQSKQQITRLALNLDRVTLVKSEEITFAGPEFGDYPAGVIDRYVLSENDDLDVVQEENFDPIVEGTIEFKELGLQAGKKLFGTFNVRFDEHRNLFGTFDTELVKP